MKRGILILTGLICGVSLVLMTTFTASAIDLQAGVEQLVQDLIQATPEEKQLWVAVADFPDLQGITNDLGRYIATRITTRLVQSKKFSVTERQRLAQVLEEMKISMSDLVDPEQARTLKKMVGVDALIVGTITDLGRHVDVDARLIEIEPNLMIWGSSVTIDKDPTLSALLDRGRGRMPKEAVDTGGTDRNLLAELRDDQPDWVIKGNNYNLVNGQLSAQGLFTASVGDSSWINYVIEFDVKQLDRPEKGKGLRVLIRRHSDTDYMGLHFGRYMQHCTSRWVIAKKGNETEVVNSGMKYNGKPRDCGGHYRIEVDGNRYKIFRDGSQMFVFNNNTFANGGVGLKSLDDKVTFTIDNFKVVSLR